MSRRSQGGSIETSGKWFVVRYWKDVPGQDKRIHACERICPISGPGRLTKAERRNRLFQIVMASGVNSPQQFAAATYGVTFREQATEFMDKARTRHRKPVKPATLCTWENCLEKWLNPNLGDLLLTDVKNAVLKSLVAKMHAAKLSPKTIVNYSGLVKLVVASAEDDNGEQLFPRKWNHGFIDMPLVANQYQPTFTAETVNAIIAKATGPFQVLYILLAGTGLRVGEAFGLEIKHLSADCRTLTVEQSCWGDSIQSPKTQNAYRQVDLCSSLADLLKAFIGDRKSGLVFANHNGKPLSQTNVVRRSLHPILKELGVKQTGFHAFRRFRTTWLRKQRAPEDLIRFWLGHADKSMTDGYSKLDEDVNFRREVAEKVGVGFIVPAPIVRSVRSESKEIEVGVSA